MTRTLAVVLALGACGGDGSGLDTKELLVKLTASDKSALCDYEASVTMARTVNCTDGSQVIVSVNKSTCEGDLATIDANCLADVGDAENCYVAFNGDPCSVGGGACTEVLACENE
jgi:hypothetical protein